MIHRTHVFFSHLASKTITESSKGNFFIKKASSFKKHILSVVISRKIPLSSTHSKLVLKQRDQLFKSCNKWRKMIFLLIHKAFYIIKTYSTTTYGVSGQFGNGQLTEKWHRCVPVWVCESAADLWIYRKNFDWHALELVFRIPKKLWCTVLKN